MTSQAEQTGEKSFKIRRGKVDSLSLYEITDHELDILERGSPASVYLNFAIFLLSIGAAFLIALSTSTVASDRTFTVFVVVTVVGVLAGVVLLILWWQTRESASKVIARIRSRIPDERETDNADGTIGSD